MGLFANKRHIFYSNGNTSTVRKAELVMNPQCHGLGKLPDALLTCICHEMGVLAVKAPSSLQSSILLGEKKTRCGSYICPEMCHVSELLAKVLIVLVLMWHNSTEPFKRKASQSTAFNIICNFLWFLLRPLVLHHASPFVPFHVILPLPTIEGWWNQSGIGSYIPEG